MITTAFDIEIYQNYFSCVFRTIETNVRIDFVIFEGRDDRDSLISFINKRLTLVGFNSLSFDIPILKALMLNYSVNQLHQLAQRIIDTDGWFSELQDIKQAATEIDGIDLKRVLSLDVSLKQVGIMLQWPKLQELPYHPTDIITPEKAKILLEYNDNDVLITRELFLRSQDDIALRENIGKTRGVDVMNASESQMANILINQAYSEITGKSYKQFRYLRTIREQIKLGDCVGKNIEFVSSQMKDFYNQIQDITIDIPHPDTKRKPKFEKILNYAGMAYTFGFGGLHSNNTSGYYESNDSKILKYVDASSFYPYLILNNHILPAHIDPAFLPYLKDLTVFRMKEKEAGNSLNAWSLKIVINSIFGKYKAYSFWLYDPLAFYTVTISGQLQLLSLIDHLETNGLSVISANTDGLFCYIDRNKLDLYNNVCEKWQQLTNLKLDFDNYSMYAGRDVNSYIAKYENGKIKTIGAFVDVASDEHDFSRIAKRSYNMPIVAKALRAFFIDNIEPGDFINKANDIYDFLIAQKPGKKFNVYYQGKRVQHTNRFYVSTNGHILQKAEHNNTQRRLSITTEYVTLLNDVVDLQADKYGNLNKDYYIQEARKIINQVKPKFIKRSLF